MPDRQFGYPNPCPVCGAKAFQRCRSLTKGKITDTHAARVRGEWPPSEPSLGASRQPSYGHFGGGCYG